MQPLRVKQKSIAELIDQFIDQGNGIDDMMLRFRNSVIVRAMTLTEGNITHAARSLKTGRENLYRWLEEYKVRETEFLPTPYQPDAGKSTDVKNIPH